MHVVICCKSIKREILNIEILSTISKPEFNRFKVECDVEVTCHSEVVEKNAHFKNYSALCHLKEKGEWISAPLFDFGKDNKFYLKLEKIQNINLNFEIDSIKRQNRITKNSTRNREISLT